MTGRERIIAEMAANGATNMQIAENLDMPFQTVGHRLKKIYRELGIVGTAGGTKRRQLEGILTARYGRRTR